MKKRILCAAICVLVLLLVACKKGTEDNHSHDHENQSEVKVHLRVGLSAQENEPQYQAAEQFAKQVEQRSGGTIKATIYGAGKLGTDAELIQYLVQDANKVDVVIASVSEFAKVEPCMDISAMPFVFEDYEDAWSFMNGDIQAEAQRGLQEKNMRVLAHYSDGFHCLTTTNKVVNQASDMRGMSIGTDDKSYSTVAMQAMEARVSVVNIDEIMQALQQGRFEGYMSNLEDIYRNRIYQKQAHLTMTNHQYDAVAFVIADSVLSSLEREEQEVIRAAATDSAYANQQLVQNQAKEMLQKIEASGVHIHYPKLSTFAEKTESVIRSYASKYGGLVEQVISYKK